jgi:hypothetical protein
MNIRLFLFVSLLVLSNTIPLFSQDENVKIKDQKGIFELSNPYLLHSIPNSGQKGFSIMYGYPGFFSRYGQTTLYYTTSSGNSFSLEIGMGTEYVMAGMNLKVIVFKSSKLYLNADFGITAGHADEPFHYLGSVGASYLLENIANDVSCEISFDMYFNHGYRGLMLFTADTPYLYGTMINIHFSKRIYENLFLIYGVGISYIEYCYVIDYHFDYRYKGFYITKRGSERAMKGGEQIYWDNKYIIPFGVSLIYHF